MSYDVCMSFLNQNYIEVCQYFLQNLLTKGNEIILTGVYKAFYTSQRILQALFHVPLKTTLTYLLHSAHN